MLTHGHKRGRPSRTEAEDLVLTTITQHADALLRTARRHSLCADDASDAYQRGLELFLRNAGRVDPARAVRWLHTVIKHEAMAVRRARARTVGAEEFDGDQLESLHAPSPDERLLAFEDVTRAAEALQGLKPQEVRALWMRMEGRTYKEIAAELSWTYTKVNRCVTEGRRAFLSRYAAIESGEECRRYEDAISAFVDGELAREQLAGLRRHLRGCGACRGTLRAIRSGQRSLGAVLPVGFVVGGVEEGDRVLGVLVRAYETLAGSLHERAVTLAAKTQAAAEVTGIAKVAAVAGAAAAVAGGGMATVADMDRERPAATKPAARQVAQHVTRTAVAAAPVVIAAPKATTAAATSTPAPTHERRRRPAAEFGFEQVAAPTSRTTTTPHTRAPSRAGGEFDLEP